MRLNLSLHGPVVILFISAVALNVVADENSLKGDGWLGVRVLISVLWLAGLVAVIVRARRHRF